MKMGNISEDKFEKDAFVSESLRVLHDAYMAKRLVLFVGAGADAPSGLPLWPVAIKDFCEHLDIKGENVDNLQVPQYYFNARGKKEYVDLCREIFGYGKDLPINDVHRKVVDFNVSTIITTNYTDFIEREAKNRGYIYKVICQDKDLAYVKKENVIIKMHGDFEHDNFVLKEDDYLQYSNNFRLMETYIKSIIATNVVLFVGYSFNDPDVKQLFTWVKDILGDDFQQAYMLEGYKDYDKNVFEYYKNLGVNVIYTKSYGENEQDALLGMLDIIKSGREKEVPNIEKADMYFQPYLGLNYILNRYVNKGLRICNLEMEHGIAKSYYRDGERQTEADSILAYLAEKIEKGESDGSGNIVLNVLKKSGTAKVEVGGKENGILSRFVDVPHEYDANFFDLVIEFDYENLRKKAEYYQFFNNGDDEQIYLKQAYVYYVLKEYDKAYFALEGAAKSAYRQQRYYTYYIVQFNKCRMGDYIQGITRIPKEIQDKIEDDLERIDLQKIIAQIPMSGNNDHQILKDIDSFQLHYSMFQDAYRISEKVKKQQETVYMFFGGNPDYIKLQWMIKDYHDFLTCNYLMVDRYRESMEVFKLYVNSIVGSACAPSKDNAEKQMKNIHVSHISRFELYLMIKYMSNKEIYNIIDRNEIDILPTEDGCIEYIKKVLVNLKSEKGIGDNEFWNCVTLIPYITSDYEIVETAIDGISDEFSNYSCTVYKRAIYKLLDSAYRQKWFKEKGEGEFKTKDYALVRFMDNIICHIEEERDSYTLLRYGELIENAMYIFSQIYEECYERDLSKILCAEKCFVAAKIFPYCNDDNKEKIKGYFMQWNEEPTVRNVDTYFEVVSKGIIEPRENYEKSIYTYLKRPEPAAQNILSNDNQDILIILYNLYMKEQLICKDDFLKAVEESEDDELRFLNNMDEFDYDKFNLEWLNRYHNSLLEKIAQNDKARSNITRLIANQVEAGNINKRLLKKYFDFFISSKED